MHSLFKHDLRNHQKHGPIKNAEFIKVKQIIDLHKKNYYLCECCVNKIMLFFIVEDIRRSIITNFKAVLNEMQITLAIETLSSCIGDVDAIREKLSPENGSRKQRMGRFLQSILQDDQNVIEFEKMLKRNGLDGLLKTVETNKGKKLYTKDIGKQI